MILMIPLQLPNLTPIHISITLLRVPHLARLVILTVGSGAKTQKRVPLQRMVHLPFHLKHPPRYQRQLLLVYLSRPVFIEHGTVDAESGAKEILSKIYEIFSLSKTHMLVTANGVH